MVTVDEIVKLAGLLKHEYDLEPETKVLLNQTIREKLEQYRKPPDPKNEPVRLGTANGTVEMDRAAYLEWVEGASPPPLKPTEGGG